MPASAASLEQLVKVGDFRSLELLAPEGTVLVAEHHEALGAQTVLQGIVRRARLALGGLRAS